MEKLSGYSQFNANIDKNNKGIRVRLRTEPVNFQGVNVWIKGKNRRNAPGNYNA